MNAVKYDHILNARYDYSRYDPLSIYVMNNNRRSDSFNICHLPLAEFKSSQTNMTHRLQLTVHDHASLG